MTWMESLVMMESPLVFVLNKPSAAEVNVFVNTRQVTYVELLEMIAIYKNFVDLQTTVLLTNFV